MIRAVSQLRPIDGNCQSKNNNTDQFNERVFISYINERSLCEKQLTNGLCGQERVQSRKKSLVCWAITALPYLFIAQNIINTL